MTRRLETVVVSVILLLGSSARVAQASSDHCAHVGSGDFVLDLCARGELNAVVLRGPAWMEDFARFEERPRSERLVYDLELPDGASVEETPSGATIKDSGGRGRIRIEQPWLVDSTGTKYTIALRAEGCEANRLSSCTIVVDWSSVSSVYPIVVDPQWVTLTGPGEQLCSGREFHTATTIGANDDYAGQVLIVGGLDDSGNPTPSVELFDPDHNTVRQCMALATPRAFHTATWVDFPAGSGAKGALLVVGGYASCPNARCDAALSTYEIYDPSINCLSVPTCSKCNNCPSNSVLFTLPGNDGRAEHTATVLPGNKDFILFAGGTTNDAATALFFNPTIAFSSNAPSASWITTPIQIPARFGHTATYVAANPGKPDIGDALFIAGGSTQPMSGQQASNGITSVIVVRPVGGQVLTFSRFADGDARDLRPARSASASLLDEAHVLLWGGADSSTPTTVDLSNYFATGGQGHLIWGDVPLGTGVAWSKNNVSADASGVPGLHGVILVGGILQDACQTSPASPYISNKELWSQAVAPLNASRVNHTVTPIKVLGNESLVVIGGATESGPCSKTPLKTLETLAVGEPGHSCNRGTDCVTGYCVDSVCCDSECRHEVGSATECLTCGSGQCVVRDGGACGDQPACNVERATCDGQHFACPKVDAGQCGAGPDGTPDASPGDVSDAGSDPDARSEREESRTTFLSCMAWPIARTAREVAVPWWTISVCGAACVRRARRRRRASQGGSDAWRH